MASHFRPMMLGLVILTLVGGCATVEREEFLALQSQVLRNKQQLRQVGQQQEAARGPQANTVAELASLRQELASLRGQMEETSHQLSQGGGPAAMAQVETKLAASLQETDKRLDRLEAHLGLKKGESGPAAKPAPRRAPPAVAKPAAPPAPMGPKELYALGHRLLKKDSFEAARGRFQEILSKHGKSSLAASAQYWVGETFYEQKKYEEAILAYNQVIKHYGTSNKVPSAMLKQGLAFASLGDKRTAKIVLRKLVGQFPKSKQAASAKKELRRLK